MLLFFRRYFGVQSLKVAMSYHLVARAQSCKGDFRKALKFEKEAFTIYKAQVRYWNIYFIQFEFGVLKISLYSPLLEGICAT